MSKVEHAVLVGAPNCGKSTLFNRLTHAGVPVGNRAGVTVSGTSLLVRGHRVGQDCPDFILTDLPGVRSLSPSGEDEAVTCNVLRQTSPGLIINVLGATTLTRCLGLTLELRETYPGIPMICVVNMCDELWRQGIELRAERLAGCLGVPVVGISAASGKGMSALFGEIASALSSAAARDGFPLGETVKAAASRGGEARLGDEAPGAGQARSGDKVPRPRDAAERAAEAARLAAASLSGAPKPHRFSERADRILLRGWMGIPIFIAVMITILTVTFGYPGEVLTSSFEWLTVKPLAAAVAWLGENTDLPVMLISVLDGCLVGGVGTVVSFLPRIVILFVLLALLEDSGYMARAAFVMDAPLRRAGLDGRAFVPMLLGFGCSVPAILATRTLTDPGERRRSILLLPLISCSARTPLYALIAGAFFPRLGGVMVGGVYLLGVTVFLIISGIMRLGSGDDVPLFVAELPRYRLPRARVVVTSAARRAFEFVRRAGSVIFISSVAIWLFSSLDCSFSITTDMEKSLLSTCAGWLTPIFRPLGFDDWRAVAALLAGVGAKEGSVSAFGVLLGEGMPGSLRASGIFTPASALSFTVFSSMYFPCAATIATMKKELGTRTGVALAIITMLAAAYIAAFAVYRLALML